MMVVSTSTKIYCLLAVVLFFSTFGFGGLITLFVSLSCFIFGFGYVIYSRGRERATDLEKEFSDLSDFRFPPGLPQLLKNRNKFNDKSCYEQIHSMTGSNSLDSEFEQILSLVMRDYVDSWYRSISSDELFRESLKRTTRRSIAALSHSVKQVDWVPFITRHVVDDFASHLRLFRMATEKAARMENAGGTATKEDLLSFFFDFELEMEKKWCRDLLSTTSRYENAYLHDLVDIILYLIMPPEDFRCRPLRFLLREVIVRRLIVPLLDYYSSPEEMNQLVVWLLSEVSPRPEDFVQCLENSSSIEELEALFGSVMAEKAVLRGKDSGGEQGVFVKQQIGSLDYVESLIKRKMAEVANRAVEPGQDVARDYGMLGDSVVQLPIHVVLTNTTAVSFFIEFLQTVGGQNYIDCFLAIEGFKVSVEHQLRSLANGESVDGEVYETIKEAAHFMYQQYLSQEAITRVPLDESVVSKFLSRLRNDEPSDFWFEHIQEKIMDVLRTDEHFYPAFKQSPLYMKMLTELGVLDPEPVRPETPSDRSSPSIASEGGRSSNCQQGEESEGEVNGGEPVTSAVVETLGIGQQGKQSFALYNVRVSRSVNGKKVSGWNVLRRYNDFHTLHTFIVMKFPKLSHLAFPGKKTFNNLDAHFLEKRTKALNQFMQCILQPSLLRSYPDLDKIVFDFLSQKEYVGTKEPLGKKVMSAMFDPIKMGVKAVGSTVMAVPEQMMDGVTRIGTGINNATKSIIPPLNPSNRPPVIQTDRVAAAITDEQSTSDSIPLRVLVLFVDEVFGVRARNAWFRRQMITMLRQIVMPFGNSLNKRIVDLVHWLTSESQVIVYVRSIRESLWPDGKLAAEAPPRPADVIHRTRVLSKILMLSSLPDELRLILGTETTYQPYVFVMFAVSHISWLCCIVFTAICGVTVFRRRKELRGDSEQNNSQFRNLQRQFLFPYLAVLLAESFQAPYLYALFYRYNYLPLQIAALYVVGLGANVIFSFYCVHLSARYGRRVLCLLCLVVGTFACSLKFFPSFLLLFVGRILDGLFAALVTSPFQQWYNHEHLINFDFPSEWISSTFTFVSLGAGFLAVVAGLLSQLTVSISREPVLPFFFSIVSLAIGGLFIGSKWQENKPIDAPLPLKTVLFKALGILRTSPLALVVCLITSCMETTIQMFVFLWSPVFIKSNILEHSQLSLGVIYASLVAAYLCGLTIFSSPIVHRLSNSKLLLISAVSAFVALLASLSDFPVLQSAWPSARFDRIFLSFLLFELAIGVYNPSMNALQDSLLPGPQRSALLALVRIPVVLWSSFAILFLFSSNGGEHKMMFFAIGLLGLSSTLSVVLDLVLTRKEKSSPDPNHIYFDSPPQEVH